MKCRLCQSENLEKYLDLGFSPPEDAFLTTDDLSKPELWYPLNVNMCLNCGLSQLGYIVPLKAKFGGNYVYDTGATPAGVEHYQEFARDITAQFNLSQNDFMLDIGSNTGVLLQAFNKISKIKVLGIDPAPIVASIANKKGIKTIAKPFGYSLAKQIAKTKGKCKLITGTNVFAHIDNLTDVMKGIDILLDKNGVFIFESPHFMKLVKKFEYDTIYHGHVSYISITPLPKLLNQFGMEVFNVVETEIHGGSIRVFIARKGKYKINKIVKDIIKRENIAKINDIKHLKKWARKVEKNALDLSKLLWSLKLKGKRIVGIGAPAKGTTLLVYSQIGTQVIDYLTEVNPLKIGRYSPGFHIPIKSDDYFLKDNPDYALILPWNFSKPIMDKLKIYKKRGGKFIIPVPSPRIIK